jgi:hypothetical protein
MTIENVFYSVVFFLLLTVWSPVPLARVSQTDNQSYEVTRFAVTWADEMSAPLKEIKPIAPRGVGNPLEAERVRLLRIQRNRSREPSNPASSTSFYQVVLGPPPTTKLLSSFEGIGKDLPFSYTTGPASHSVDKFRVRVAPPDANGAVGETQYVQWVNTSLAVFDKKTGGLLYGPVQGRTVWQNFDDAACENDNDGDPIVQYDKINRRWILAQFAVKRYRHPRTNEDVLVPPFSQCIAVSETSDALGKYRRFKFTYDLLNDFPKMGVWLDGYYTTFNMFGRDDVGALVCVYDKDVMLGLNTQRKASQQCVQLPARYLSLLPADIDGPTLPDKGAPNYLLSLDPNASGINLWKFHVDWTDEKKSVFSGPVSVRGVEIFDVPCSDLQRGDCIKQGGTDQTLESLSDRLSYRLAYRRFPHHEVFVFSHIVSTNTGAAAIRWYEMRSPFDDPTIYQSGTFAPGADSRWISSIAMDKLGNIGLGYTVSGGNRSPAIYFTGHNVADKRKGRLERETAIVDHGGSQRCILANGECAEGCLLADGRCVSGLARWGDYSSLSLDPSDDCTMWYTAEYLKTDGGYNWSTRIARFKFKSCH